MNRYFVTGEVRPRWTLGAFWPLWTGVDAADAEGAVAAYRERFGVSYDIQKVYPPQLLGPAEARPEEQNDSQVSEAP